MRISDWSSDVCSSDLAHCLMLELFGMLDHLVGLLLRDLIAQVTGAKPLQVHMGATGRKSGWKKGTWIMRRFNKFALALVLGLGTVSATALIAPSEIGRASGRERVCKYGYNPVDA